MTKPAAFSASYSDMKLIKTRKCVQLVFEIPLEHYKAAEQVLGGLPDPAAERWFGIAALSAGAVEDKPEQARPAKEKKDWRDMPPAQQAAIRCNERVFEAFLKETYGEDWKEHGNSADFVRAWCGVVSRADIGKEQSTRVLWHQLDSQFQAWKAAEVVRA